MAENGKSDWLRWALGIAFALLSSIAGYNINQSIENESRVKALEIEFLQARTELTDLWEKYNLALDGKEDFTSRLILLEYKIERIDDHLKEMKK
jgi:hypothetical protein